jgi:hypothetical protein
MKIPEWLISVDRDPDDPETRLWLADRLEVDPISVGRYLDGSRRPDQDRVMPKLIKLTQGLVSANDYIGPKRQPKARRRRPDERRSMSA